MDHAEKTMRENLLKISGKQLEEWIEIVKQKRLTKHGEIQKFLKDEHDFTYGYANLVALKALGTDAGSAESADVLIDKQYVGKEHFRPIYDLLMHKINQFGADVELAPKNAYVSLRRKKQFAILQPATKTRFEIGINLKGQEPDGVLELVLGTNNMCSHRIKIESENDITPEVINWIRLAYDKSN
jgi:predicted transport protein/putative transposon-encoded protein